ncbi:MAG: NifU family protein [Burkholderiales bacterium]|nr:NifU family protein [Burkholderiales bacterium]
MSEDAARRQPKLDAPFYTEAELDALERSDPRAALRIARAQAELERQLAAQVPAGAELPTPEALAPLLDEVRSILARDGGDLSFEKLEDGVLYVRLKGACAGCPRAPLDLKHVVETLVRRRYPALREVRNVF